MANKCERIPGDILAKCREEYIHGKGSIRDVALRNGVSHYTLRYHSNVGEWSRLREEYQKARDEQVLQLPGQVPQVEVPALDYQGQVQSFLNSASVIEEQWKECVAEASNDSLTPSERVAFHRASVQLSIRWQEVLRIPAVAAIKVEEKKSSSETPAIPLEE